MGCLKIKFQNANDWYYQNIPIGGVDGKNVEISHCAQWANNRYQKDNHLPICKFSETSE